MNILLIGCFSIIAFFVGKFIEKNKTRREILSTFKEINNFLEYNLKTEDNIFVRMGIVKSNDQIFELMKKLSIKLKLI
ncbi:hypothetical protein [Enterococcus mundtii]|uniref:hypothetical protein n=1 Tax=Enterococcus mundtii TaxID=53346 RepID=UPI001A96351A|nr:hypothetical protein [Enterococcus mundtii]MBO1087155.1 hypothetical protein [Enterococcus mundtii]